MRGRTIATTIAIAAIGCATSQGVPDAAELARQLTPGLSTLADATAILGEPTDVRDYATSGKCCTWTRVDARWGFVQKTSFHFLCFDAEGRLGVGLPAPVPEAPPPGEATR